MMSAIALFLTEKTFSLYVSASARTHRLAN